MKKIIFSLSLLLAGSAYNNVSAQLPDGSTAPNFTATDINGVSHTLYDYLDAGKTVIMDISATWCSPCWGYHNSHALADLYNVYGPGGSDEVVVLFIEGDNQTTIADLHGTGGNTQGDWVSGTPYPIINNGTIANQYDIAGFPTIFRICPNRVLTDIGQPTFAQLKTSIQNGCSVSLAGAQNNPHLEANDMESCTSLIQPTFTVKNYGTNSLTSATILLKENGTTIQTKNWAGSIAAMASETISFPFISANSTSTYTTEVTAVNSGAILHPENGMSQYVVNLAQVTPSLDLTIKFRTDYYSSETSWEMKNSANVVVASASYNAGDSLTTKTHTVSLPDANDCYSISIMDSYGDGLNTGSNPDGQYGIDIEANGETILNLAVGNFGDLFNRIGAFKTELSQTSGLNKNEANSFVVSPNPSTGNFSIKGEALTSYSTVELVDQLGRTLSTWNIKSTSLNIEMNDLANGNYMLVFKGANGNATEKIQINK